MKRGSLGVGLIALVMAACTSHAHKASPTPTPTPSLSTTPAVSTSPASSPHPKSTSDSVAPIPKTPSSSGGARQAFYPSISGDGQLVAFESYRRHPGQCYFPGDADPGGEPTTCSDIYRYNFATKQTVLVSRTHNGVAANGPSYVPTISGNGRYVAFLSTTTNFFGPAPQARLGNAQVYVDDTAPIPGDVVLASASPSGAPGDHSSCDARISGDGHWVVFESTAGNLAPEGPTAECVHPPSSSTYVSPCHEIFLRDLINKRTVRLTRSLNGGQPNSDSANALVSADGSVVEFQSLATNLTAEGKAGTFVYTRADGKLRLIPNSPTLHGSGIAILSRDGSNVVYVVATAPDHQSIYRYNVAGRTTAKIGDHDPPVTLFDVSADGKSLLVGFQSGNTYVQGPTGTLTLALHWTFFYGAVMDETGSFIAFDSAATNIVSPDPNGKGIDVYLRDVAKKTTQRVPR